MDRERPVIWEADEDAQFLTVVFSLLMAGYSVHYLWNRDWAGLLWLGQIIVSLAIGILIWSALGWLILRTVLFGAERAQDLRQDKQSVDS